MVALTSVFLNLPAQPSQELPPVIYDTINDLYIALNHLASDLNGRSPVMLSPNGHYWTGAISNTGVVTWTDVGTTAP